MILCSMCDGPSTNPLQHATQVAWDRLVASVNPPALLVAIHGFMGERLRLRVDAEDVWQETLLRAWRDREVLDWRGLPAFRRWLLEVARNRIHDLANNLNAQKRGGGGELTFADRSSAAAPTTACAEHYAGPAMTTTPSRVVSDRERAAAMRSALEAVPVDCRDVVRLRLFEDMTMEEIGTQLDLGVEGVRYRFRQGAEAYRRGLRRCRLGPEGTGVESSE